jgi:tetratricopeptide (TPR) repeat protein
MSLGEEINDVTGHSYCHCRIRIYLLSGELDRAEHWANKLYTFRKDVIPSFRALFLAEIARVKIALGKLPEGEAILEQAFDDFDNEGFFSYAAAPLFVADAYFQLALANPERALDRMHALAQRLADSGSQYYLAEALWLQGKACLALEKVEQASDALQEAVLAAEYTGERTVLWQVLAMLADLKTMSGNELEAKKLRERSLEIVSYIADHAGSDDLRASFLAQPAVAQVLTA